MRRISAFLLCFVLGVMTGWSQSVPGSVEGKVSGPSGAPLSGATIALTQNGSQAAPRTTTSDAQGNFIFRGLQPGIYSARASRIALQSRQIDGIVVRSGVSTSIAFVLAPLSTTAMVNHAHESVVKSTTPPPPTPQPVIAPPPAPPPPVENVTPPAPDTTTDVGPPTTGPVSVMQQQEAEFQSLQTGVIDWILPQVMYPNVPSVVRIQIHGAKSTDTLQGADGSAVIKVSDTMYVTLRCISNPAEFTITPPIEEQAKQQKPIWSTSTQEWSFNVTPNHPSSKERLEVAAFMVYPPVNGQQPQARFIKSWDREIDVAIPPVPRTIWQSMWDKPALWFGPTGILVIAAGYFTKFFGLFKKKNKDEKTDE